MLRNRVAVDPRLGEISSALLMSSDVLSSFSPDGQDLGQIKRQQFDDYPRRFDCFGFQHPEKDCYFEKEAPI